MIAIGKRNSPRRKRIWRMECSPRPGRRMFSKVMPLLWRIPAAMKNGSSAMKAV